MRDWLVADIRSAVERRTFGWIPGSRQTRPDRIEAGEGGVIVACQSGSRSADLVAAIGSDRVLELDGGHRAWVAGGLPVCLPTAPPPLVGPLAPLVLVRELRSWFVIESVERHGAEPAALDRLDPVGLFDGLFCPSEAPTSHRAFMARLDRLAEIAWWDGHRLDVIARGMERFAALADVTAWARPPGPPTGG